MNTPQPNTTIDQWNIFRTLVACGSYAKAAELMNRSQSTLSYSVAKLQEQLGLKLLETEGRKAVLTPEGKTFVDDANALVEGFLQIEGRAKSIAKGHEQKIRLVVDTLCDEKTVVKALEMFLNRYPDTEVALTSVTWSELDQRYDAQEGDIYITTHMRAGLVGNAIGQVNLIAVASPKSQLIQLGRELSRKDLITSLYIKVELSDDEKTGPAQNRHFVSPRTWKVNSLSFALESIRKNLGFGWMPEHLVVEDIRIGKLKEIPLQEGQKQSFPIHLVYRQRYGAGPATQGLAKIITQCFARNNS